VHLGLIRVCPASAGRNISPQFPMAYTIDGWPAGWPKAELVGVADIDPAAGGKPLARRGLLAISYTMTARVHLGSAGTRTGFESVSLGTHSGEPADGSIILGSYWPLGWQGES